MGTILERIDGPEDVKCLDREELEGLAAEIRAVLIEYCGAHGGHVGSNLATVEPIIALHKVFNPPHHDHIVFDVSHQAYTHKMLTGRRRAFTDPSLYGTVSGFTCPEESPYDDFMLGHTGTSISLACGLARMRDLTGDDGNVVAFIGDGSLSSGPAFEGLDWAAEQGGNLIVILNDNEMSIAENHGGLYRSLTALRRSGGRSAMNPFRDLGLDYRYVEEGNDLDSLIDAFEAAKDIDHPILIHIHTRKGLGLGHGRRSGSGLLEGTPAEGRVEGNHWEDARSSVGNLPNSRKTYGRLAMQALQRRFADEPGLVVISPATALSNGIDPEFRRQAGSHYMDVGITESNAVALAAGMARAGGHPVVATSSTFFQRAYDQIEQEMALNGSAVTLLNFSTGISGTDVTHSGVSDIAMMTSIPGLTCLAPTGAADFLSMLAWATGPAHRPVVIRVPGELTLAYERGQGILTGEYPKAPVSDGTFDGGHWEHYRTLQSGQGVALLALGDTLPLARATAAILTERTGRIPTLVDPGQYSLMDGGTLDGLGKGHRLVATLEDGQVEGGWGQRIASYFGSSPVHVINFGPAREFNDRVPVGQLRERYGMTPVFMASRLEEAMKGMGRGIDG